MIRKIFGKDKKGPLKHLSKNYIKATNRKDIADLAKTFSKQSPHLSIIVKRFRILRKMQKRTN